MVHHRLYTQYECEWEVPSLGDYANLGSILAHGRLMVYQEES